MTEQPQIRIDFRTRPYASGMLVATGLFLFLTALSFVIGIWYYTTHGDNGFTLENAQTILGHRTLSLSTPWMPMLLKMAGGEAHPVQWFMLALGGIFINIAVLGTIIGAVYQGLIRIYTEERINELGLIPMLAAFVFGLYGILFVLANLKSGLVDLNFPALWALALGIVFLGAASVLKAYTKPDKTIGYWNKTFVVCVAILGLLWAYWYVRIGMWEYWTEEDEKERLAMPAIELDFSEVKYGMTQKEVKDLFTAKGLRMRCYADIRPNEGIESSDTHTCWTIAQSVWNMPSKMIGFSFGSDGLRHIKVDFFGTEQDHLIEYLRNLDGEFVGEFGRDQGGNRVVAVMMEHGLLTTTRTNNMPSATLLWSSRERVLYTVCQKERLTAKQRRIMCNIKNEGWTEQGF